MQPIGAVSIPTRIQMTEYVINVRKKGGVWQYQTEFSGWNNGPFYRKEQDAVRAGKANILSNLRPIVKFKVSRID